jgi:YD repeat-containing protein
MCTRHTIILVLAFGCGGGDEAKVPGPGERPAPAAADAARPAAPAAVVDAAVAAKPADAGPQLGSDGAYASKSEWAMRWAVAMNRPQPTSSANPDWPCAEDIDANVDGKVDLVDRFRYGGPTTCQTPPDQLLMGCPTWSFSDDTSAPLDTTEVYAYDEAGHLVAMRRTNEMRVRQVLYTWDGDRLTTMESDSNDDGVPDEHARYTPDEDDTIRYEEQHSDGTWETKAFIKVVDNRVVERRRPRSEVRYEMADGNVMVTPRPGSLLKVVWKDGRPVERLGIPEGKKKAVERGTYRFDCPEAPPP